MTPAALQKLAAKLVDAFDGGDDTDELMEKLVAGAHELATEKGGGGETLTELAAHESLIVRCAMARVPARRDLVLKLLEDEDTEVRDAALETVVSSKGKWPEVVALGERLVQEKGRARAEGLALLVAAGEDRAEHLQALITLAAKGKGDAAASARSYLRDLPSAMVSTALEEAMKSDDPDVRAHAVGLYGSTMPLAAVAHLGFILDMLTDEASAVRETAAFSLGRGMGPLNEALYAGRTAEIRPRLEPLLTDKLKPVRAAAEQAWKRLGLGG
jgi:HEAT repeat protein